MAALLAACLAFQLNASMLSPALVSIERQLRATAPEVAATQTAFFTAAALFSLFLPRLADILGRRRVLALSLLAMAVGCVVAALAPNIGVLFAGRVLQGASGPVIPIALVMLRAAVPDPKRYGTLMGVVAAINGGIAGFDALLGGYLVTHHGFASIFWTMAAVAVVAAAAVRLLTPESFAKDRRRLDVGGSVLLVVAVGAALVCINEVGRLGDANPALVGGTAVLAAAGAIAFWQVEKRHAAPLVPVTQLRERSTWALVATTTLTLGGVFAIMNGLLPALAQDDSLGYQLDAEAVSALVLTPYAVAGLLVGPLSGRLAATIGYRTMLRVGIGGAAVGLVGIMSGVGGTSPVFLFAVAVWVGVTYAGIANIMLNGLGIVLSPADRPGSLPGLNTGAFNIGAGLSFVVVYAVQAAAPTGDGPTLGYVAGTAAGVLLLVGAFLMSFAVPRPTSAEAATSAPVGAHS